MKKITKSEKETLSLGKTIASQFKGGEMLCLYGNLGAGKTTFAKGIARGLGIKKPITSPTFVLMKKYPVTGHGSLVTGLVHIDTYRIKSDQEIVDLGFDEILQNKRTVVVIEWPEKIKNILPKERIDIYFYHKKENERVIEIMLKT